MANKKEKQIPYVIAAPAEPIKVTLAPHDVNSRYKTKQIVVQSFGNRTVFQNLEQNAKKYMQIPASYLIIYFGYQLGVPTKHESTGTKQLSLSGLHDPKKLSKICQDFVKEVLLCPRCKLPEISLSIGQEDNTKKVKGKCRSCGFQGWMFANNPKFANFVIKNPPATVNDFGNRMDHDFLSKFSNMNVSEAFFTSSSSTSSDEEPQEPSSFEDEVREAMQSSQPSSKMSHLEELVKEHRKSASETSQAVFDFIFGKEVGEKDIIATLQTNQGFLKVYLHSEPQRLNSFLECFMQRLGSIPGSQQKIVWKKFYDEEVLEEEELIQWFDANVKSLEEKHPSAMEAVKTFVEWLKQPSDESDEE
mmetsp:Transcript_7019/g.9701  ORF Transcript_7019/g.9701 Transcript_7019/m.9701 type:complete len:361 (-) Transcript_7019:71-1153(-)